MQVLSLLRYLFPRFARKRHGNEHFSFPSGHITCVKQVRRPVRVANHTLVATELTVLALSSAQKTAAAETDDGLAISCTDGVGVEGWPSAA